MSSAVMTSKTSAHSATQPGTPGPARRSFLQRFRRNQDGFTAVEFAIVSIPFFMMLFGCIGIGIFFFTTFALENAVEVTAREIRTGQAQAANMTQAQFKTALCNNLPGYIDCASRLRVNVQSFVNFGSVAPAQCLDAGSLITDGNSSYNAGASGTVTLVRVCYEWDFAKLIPFLTWSNMNNDSVLIQASAIFQNE